MMLYPKLGRKFKSKNNAYHLLAMRFFFNVIYVSRCLTNAFYQSLTYKSTPLSFIDNENREYRDIR